MHVRNALTVHFLSFLRKDDSVTYSHCGGRRFLFPGKLPEATAAIVVTQHDQKGLGHNEHVIVLVLC